MATSLPELIKQLDAQREAYIDTLKRVNDELLQSGVAASPSSPEPRPSGEAAVPASPTSVKAPSASIPSLLSPRARTFSGIPSTFDSSTLSDDSDDDDESYYVQELLPSHSYDHEHLRDHLKTYEWDEHGRQILAGIVTDRGRLKNPSLFPTNPGPAEDRSHYSHYQVFDVGKDGSPLLIESKFPEHETSKANTIWHTIKDINADGNRRQAVGRITIAREPSPVLFGALHLTMHKYFDVDELFRQLVTSETSSAHFRRAYEEDPRRQRTFLFVFEYWTIIGDDCRPMDWQLADRGTASSEFHLPLTRCNSVTALYLHGDPIRKVLNIQCYPDWRASTDVHDSSRHYLNGPEAFLNTLLHELRDAQVRFDEIHRRISKLIVPSRDFIFNDELRDRRLFEDQSFTFTRRYFWAHQTLGLVNDSIKSIVDAFEDTFTDDVWEGKDKVIWPVTEDSARNEYFRKRMRQLRLAFEKEMKALRIIIQENKDRQAEIRSLRDQLFSGTSVLESRKSVELAEITTQQGHNIKILTLVNIFFLPLTFVTSVYGMTNMSTKHEFWMFGTTMACVCIPFFLLVGSLNTTTGLRFWTRLLMKPFTLLRRKKKEKLEPEDESTRAARLARSMSAEQGITIRMGPSPTQETVTAVPKTQ